MNDVLAEFQITCPYCWEIYSLWLEAEAPGVELIEDCQICCHPIQLRLHIDINGEVALDIERAL